MEKFKLKIGNRVLYVGVSKDKKKTLLPGKILKPHPKKSDWYWIKGDNGQEQLLAWGDSALIGNTFELVHSSKNESKLRKYIQTEIRSMLKEGYQTVSDVLVHLEDTIIPKGLSEYKEPKIESWLKEFWSYFGTGRQRKKEIETILKYTNILDKVKKKTKFDLEAELKSKL